MSSTLLSEVTSSTNAENEGKLINKKKDQTPSQELRFSQKILNIGFAAAIILAATCLLLGAAYLYVFLTNTNAGVYDLINNASKNQLSDQALSIAINARLVMARVALLSCGVFVGMSFGFLGFALFLVGAKGELSATAEVEGYAVKLARMSPGVFVLLCATILIGVCISRQTPFSYEQQNANSNSPTQPTKVGQLPNPGNDLKP